MRNLRGDKAAKAETEIDGGDDADDADEEEEEEGEQDGLKAFEEIEGECKLVLIVRTDLGMNKGSSPCPIPLTYHIPTMLNKPPPAQAKSPPKPHTPRYTITKSSPHTHSLARCYGGGTPQGKRKSLCRRNQKSSLRNCRLKR